MIGIDGRLKAKIGKNTMSQLKDGKIQGRIVMQM